jgi:hypothetical protein
MNLTNMMRFRVLQTAVFLTHLPQNAPKAISVKLATTIPQESSTHVRKRRLVAQWVKEDGKLVCKWVIDDESTESK